MEPNHQYRRAAASLREVLAELKPHDLSRPTPCEGWSVDDLLEHLVDVHHTVTRNADPDAVGERPERRGDRVTALEELTERLAAVYSGDVLERTHPTPMGEVSGAVLLHMVTVDAFVHAWDLARTLGRPTDLDPGLAEELLVAVRGRELPRGEGAPFGPERPVPADAPAADRLAGFLGRRV